MPRPSCPREPAPRPRRAKGRGNSRKAAAAASPSHKAPPNADTGRESISQASRFSRPSTESHKDRPVRRPTTHVPLPTPPPARANLKPVVAQGGVRRRRRATAADAERVSPRPGEREGGASDGPVVLPRCLLLRRPRRPASPSSGGAKVGPRRGRRGAAEPRASERSINVSHVGSRPTGARWDGKGPGRRSEVFARKQTGGWRSVAERGGRSPY